MYVTYPHPELSKALRMRAHPWHCAKVGRHRTARQLLQKQRWRVESPHDGEAAPASTSLSVSIEDISTYHV